MEDEQGPGANLGLQLAALMHASESQPQQQGLQRIPTASPGGLSLSQRSLPRSHSKQVVAPKIVASPSSTIRDKRTAIKASEEILVMAIARALVDSGRKMAPETTQEDTQYRFDIEETVAQRATAVFEYYCTRASMTNVESMGNLMFKRVREEFLVAINALMPFFLSFSRCHGHLSPHAVFTRSRNESRYKCIESM